MNMENKIQIRNKTRQAYGLLNVLIYDMDTLRHDVYDFNLDKIKDDMTEVNVTLQKLMLIINQIEYVLKLDKIEGP